MTIKDDHATQMEELLIAQFDISCQQAIDALREKNYHVYDTAEKPGDEQAARLTGAWAGFLHDVLVAARDRQDTVSPIEHTGEVIDILSAFANQPKFNGRAPIKALTPEDRALLSARFSEFRIADNPISPRNEEAYQAQRRYGPNSRTSLGAAATATLGALLIAAGFTVGVKMPERDVPPPDHVRREDSRQLQDKDWATRAKDNAGNALFAAGGLALLTSLGLGIARYSLNHYDHREDVADANAMMKDFLSLMANTTFIDTPHRSVRATR